MDKKVSVFVISKNRNVLLLRTNSKVYKESYWSIVNGGLKKGESFESAAKRETKEETGLDIKNLIYSGYSSNYEYPKGNLREKKIFIGFVENEKIILSDEHEDSKWIGLNNLKEVFSWTESEEVLDKIVDKIKELFRKNENN
ncbi:MAG: NUDIX domain-containing protein [Nanoarchaeota archaeon]